MHGHGDHWFTADMLAKRFGADVLASAGTIQQNAPERVDPESPLHKPFPGQIPPAPVTAVTLKSNRFALRSRDLIIVEVGHTDTDETSVPHVPDLRFVVVAGDASPLT